MEIFLTLIPHWRTCFYGTCRHHMCKNYTSVHVSEFHLNNRSTYVCTKWFYCPPLVDWGFFLQQRQTIMIRLAIVLGPLIVALKETKSATMNIFRNFLFPFLIICNSRIKLFLQKKSVHYSWKLRGKVNYLIKQVCFSLFGNYLRPSNNYRQSILT